MNKVIVSIIYVYYNTPLEIVKSLKSIPAAVGKLKYEVLIIDNLSPNSIPKDVNKILPSKIINNKENNGYGRALNQGAKIAKGEYLLFVNPDTVFLENSISLMVGKMKSDPAIGILGPQFLNEEKKVSITGNGMPLLPDALFAFSFLNKIFPNSRFSKRYYLANLDRTKENEIPVICGACMLMRKTFFEKIRGFDEQFFMYFEESDICLRVKKMGLKVIYFPKAKVIHFGGKSSDDKVWIRKTFEESRYKFFRKYHNAFSAFLGHKFLQVSNNLSRLI